MSNFRYKIAMKCTEKEFRDHQVQGMPLKDFLIGLGYDLSQLRFVPNLPYLATFYKKIPSMVGTTSTPFKDGRDVFEETDLDLFLALCCMREGNTFHPLEFITQNDSKELHQISNIAGKWLQCDLKGGGNIAFQQYEVHKSSVQELMDFFNPVPEEVPVHEPEKEKDLPVDVEVKAPVVKADTENTIGLTINDDPVAVKEKTYIIRPKLDLCEVLEDLQKEESKSHLEQALETLKLSKADPKENPFQNDKMKTVVIDEPMTPEQVLHAMMNDIPVWIGSEKENSLGCFKMHIQNISKDWIFMDDSKHYNFSNVFESKEAFLRHALKQIAKQ